MTPLTPLLGDYLSNLAAELSAHVLAAIPAWLQTAWRGDETDTAVRRCLDAGIAAFIRRAKADAPVYAELWDIVFPHFFADEQVAGQVVLLLDGRRLNGRALQFMAANAGYQPERFPALDFEAALQEFEGAFLTRATHETALQGIIQANQLLQQTQLLAETKDMLARMVDLLAQIALKDIVGISADTITATNVVSGTQIIYQLAPPKSTPSRFPDYWEKRYLDSVVAECSGLDLTVLAASEATSETLTIASVFTTLYLDGVSRTADEQVADVVVPLLPRRSEPEDYQREMARQEKERLPITAVEAVADVPRLVILGQPGGGKSTLVNHIATQLARQRRGDENIRLPGWPAAKTPLPVRIVLRRFADWLAREKRSGTAGDVWDYLAYLLNRWGCTDSYEGLRHTLINDGGIVFFDGLDEIRQAEARRDILKGAVASFAATENKCQVVVTSRPYAYADKANESEAQPKVSWRLPDDQFAVVTLASFGQEQIETFCQAWYMQVMKPRRGWDEPTCQNRADWLARTIDNRSHLKRLAASPLLLTLIAQVDSSGPETMLPNNRADLYRQMVSLLLARWENRIPLDSRQGDIVPEDLLLWLEGVPTQDVREVLTQLAFTGHEQQGQHSAAVGADGPAVEISRQDLKAALVDKFDSGKKAEEIITYIQHRAGLLVDKGEGVFTFPHRTYQEFLAAQYLLSQSDGFEQLCHRLKKQPDWWREVFLLSAGSSMTVPKNVQDLLNTLLPFEPGAREMPLTPEVATWVQIGAQTLEETNFKRSVEQEKTPGGFTAVYRRVQSWLKAALVAETVLLPKARAEVGQWLARLGDDRPGVGIVEQNGVKLPDIIWSKEIPAGTYTIGDDKSKYSSEKPRRVQIQRPYRLARYPVTNAQFQCFVDAVDRDNPKWWKSIPDNERKFSEPQFPYASHPRETVSWYQAVAFCRWLTQKLHDGLLLAEPLTGDLKQYTITLPHEYEWEVAARWPNEGVQQRIYPWGPEFDAAKANTNEGGIGQTTAAGLHPSGKNTALDLFDLSGNVWEWCRNRYYKPESELEPEVVYINTDSRVLRGGSWVSSQVYARAASRRYDDPGLRSDSGGFRVVVVRFSPSHQGH
ncbi:MAG: SUMF1/EgtB/PvdO family nonheme iron enzyme [Anaerolineales bacterium]|nr:SUMF1/EgtB/PvdO family nonheme iron enzyme [Anaerolineales bacterium]